MQLGFVGLNGWGGGLSEALVADEGRVFVLPENVESDIGGRCAAAVTFGD